MMRHALIFVLAATMLAGGIGLVAQAAGQDATPAVSTPSPGPIAYGAATLVSGSIVSLSLDPGTITTDADGALHARGGRASYVLDGNDPRVYGLVSGTWQFDGWEADREDNSAIIQWGTETLSTQDGTWEAQYTGVYTDATGDAITWWYVGSGAYEGLTFFMWLTDPELMTWSGLIYPGTPPPGA